MKNQAILFLFLSFSLLLVSLQTQAGTRELEATVIPDEAIRLRILANSNSLADQEVKRHIRDVVRAEITSWVEDYTSLSEARAVIKQKLPAIRELVSKELAAANVDIPYSVKLGNYSFPTKLYGTYIYPAGQYETVLITLGEGKGANWWCVLFPPLCFINIDNSEAVTEERANTPGDDELEQGSDGFEEEEDGSDDEHGLTVKFFLVDLITRLFETLKEIIS